MASNQEAEERLRAALAERYQIDREIGAGGMATVYLAQDLKHHRKVAIKVLNPELSAVVGNERFLAEIRTTANLSHPHILPLHDSGEADGFLFYVMPYVEGEDLRQKLDRDGQLPVEEAIRIASRVADALDYAHRNGVIHRDLKPANILFQDGEPVVADFGIALAVSAAGKGRLTETGLSLGTPYYMSPEQAAGDQVPTAASDVYSLGCVLYEMLTGDPPHTGSSAQAILGKILLGEVTRPTALRRTIPTNVEGAILKALERLPADRFESVAGVSAALKDKTFRHGVGVGATSAGGLWNWLTLSFGSLAALTFVVALTGILAPEPSPPGVIWQRIHPPGDGPITEWARYFALAPDGSRMVYRGTVGLASGHQLWVKERGSLDPSRLSGTEGAVDVVFSPDGQSIVYKVGSDLMKRPIQGTGTETLLEDVDMERQGISWLDDGTILSGLAIDGEWPLVRIFPERASPPDTVVDLHPEDAIWVHGLPGEEAALVVRCIGVDCRGGSYLSAVDLRADTTWVLLDDVLRAWYVPTGHIVWVAREGGVFGAPFDLARLKMSSVHTPLFDGVRTTSFLANMVVGDDGTVFFVQGSAAGTTGELVWVDRGGGEEVIDVGLVGNLSYPSLNQDDTQLAVQLNSGEMRDIWIAQLRRGSNRKLTTFGDGGRPTWTPDGQSVTFYSERGGGTVALWTKSADGSGEAELVLEYERDLAEVAWSPEGDWLIARTNMAAAGNGDILAWHLPEDTTLVPLLDTEFREVAPALSPNGRFLAYTCDESGVNQVYVRPFPNVDDWQEQVSIESGTEPVWAKDGRELFYRRDDGGELVAVEVETADSFDYGEEQVLFPAGGYWANLQHPQYDVSSDGQRFVMLRPAGGVETGTGDPLIQILNWFVELEERLGGGR